MARISAADRAFAMKLAKDDKLTAAEADKLKAKGFTAAEIADIRKQAKDGAGLTAGELKAAVPPAGGGGPSGAQQGAAQTGGTPAPAPAPAAPAPAPAAPAKPKDPDADISKADKTKAMKFGEDGKITAAEEKKLKELGFGAGQIDKLVKQSKDGKKLTAAEVAAVLAANDKTTKPAQPTDNGTGGTPAPNQTAPDKPKPAANADISQGDRNVAVKFGADGKFTEKEKESLKKRGYSAIQIAALEKQAKDGKKLTEAEVTQTVKPAADAKGINQADRQIAAGYGNDGKLTEKEKKDLAKRGFTAEQITQIAAQAKDGKKLTGAEILSVTQTKTERIEQRRVDQMHIDLNKADQKDIREKLKDKKLSKKERAKLEKDLAALEKKEKQLTNRFESREDVRQAAGYEQRRTKLDARIADPNVSAADKASARRERELLDLRNKINNSTGKERAALQEKYDKLLRSQLKAEGATPAEKAEIKQRIENRKLRDELRDPKTSDKRKAEIREQLEAGQRVISLNSQLRNPALSEARKTAIRAEARSFNLIERLKAEASNDKNTPEQRQASKDALAAAEAARARRDAIREKYAAATPDQRALLYASIRAEQASESRRQAIFTAYRQTGDPALVELLKSEAAGEAERAKLRAQLTGTNLGVNQVGDLKAHIQSLEKASAERVKAAIEAAKNPPAAEEEAEVEENETEADVDTEASQQTPTPAQGAEAEQIVSDAGTDATQDDKDQAQIDGDLEGGLGIESDADESGMEGI